MCMCLSWKFSNLVLFCSCDLSRSHPGVPCRTYLTAVMVEVSFVCVRTCCKSPIPRRERDAVG